jgi:hypothetical protein
MRCLIFNLDRRKRDERRMRARERRNTFQEIDALAIAG